CMLCRHADADPDTCGHKLQGQGICAHVFCLFFAYGLFQQQSKDVGLMGFLPEDIRRTAEQAAQKVRTWQVQPSRLRRRGGRSGPPIRCHETGCNRTFHLPCAVKGECVTQYIFQYRASRLRLVFLLQGQAACNGVFRFQCPLCRNTELFLTEMILMGIRIPIRLPGSENIQAYEALTERHSRCDASECLCPRGREQAEEEGPWQLVLCSSCAAEGTHRGCSSLKDSTVCWECRSCAGLDT
ncbi:PREDICTED: PHD finger protein 7-like, partial [Tauraco erythrolophus]|uniref:PHD finger protein 7-like n=1 Tax=Tauraco erythrolophus TaxID=121530 RepID=UPI000523F0AD